MPADLNVRNVLELDGLTVSADGRTTPILDGVSCALKATEILGVVGETGAGKSILARSLIGLLPPGVSMVRGEIRLEGRPLSTFEGEERLDQKPRITHLQCLDRSIWSAWSLASSSALAFSTSLRSDLIGYSLRYFFHISWVRACSLSKSSCCFEMRSASELRN